MNTYSEKLKDPRWQKKRLEILNRDNWECFNCGDKKSTLHVHHRCYLKGKDPWDYPDEYLVALCEDCHIQETENIDFAIQSLIDNIKIKFLSYQIYNIAEGFKNYNHVHLPEVCASAIKEFLEDENEVKAMINKMFK